MIVVDRGKSSGTLSTGVSEPDRGVGCPSACGYHVRVVINSWCVSQLSQVNPDISVFQVDLIRLESLLLYGVFQRS